MTALKILKLAELCKGEIISGADNATDKSIVHISIDSRDVPEGTLFVPIVGERVDAHRFLPDVIMKGAAAAFVSAAWAEKELGDPASALREALKQQPGFVLIRVDDTLSALQRLGAAWRVELGLPLIGITGSVGKTTTREMVAAALSAGKNVYKTPANHNSQIGVPLTLLDITEAHELGVIEMGMSNPGEMTKLSAMVKPDAAVFTNIGDAHVEQLGSRENILEEKMHIRDGMKHADCPVILNGDDSLLRGWAEAHPEAKTILYGREEGFPVYAENIHMNSGCAEFTAVVHGSRVTVSLSVYGAHQISNALAALAAAALFGINLSAAAEKLHAFNGYRHRQQIFRNNGIVVIDDSYNASPVSMCAALDILKGMEGRRIAVLADMKELGTEGPDMHFRTGKYLAETKAADLVFTLGELSFELARGIRENADEDQITVKTFTDRNELEAALFAEAAAGDAVLFKGSNSMKLSIFADRMSGNE